MDSDIKHLAMGIIVLAIVVLMAIESCNDSLNYTSCIRYHTPAECVDAK